MRTRGFDTRIQSMGEIEALAMMAPIHSPAPVPSWTWQRQRRSLTYRLTSTDDPRHDYAAVVDDFGNLVIVAYCLRKDTQQ